MSDSNYSVYVYLDPRRPGVFKYGRWKFDHEPIYVGMGRPKRPRSHLKNSHSRTLNARIKQIRKDGVEPIVLIKRDNLTAEAAYDIEVTLIRRIGRKDLGTGPLFNLIDCSGAGPKVVSERTKKKISRITKNQMATMTFADRLVRDGKISDGLKMAYQSGVRDAIKAGKNISAAKQAKGSFYDRMTKKQQREYSARRSASTLRTWEDLSSDPDRLEAFKAKVSANSKNMHDNMTENQKLSRAEKIRQTILKRYAAMTPEQKAARSSAISNGMKKEK